MTSICIDTVVLYRKKLGVSRESHAVKFIRSNKVCVSFGYSTDRLIAAGSHDDTAGQIVMNKGSTNHVACGKRCRRNVFNLNPTESIVGNIRIRSNDNSIGNGKPNSNSLVSKRGRS